MTVTNANAQINSIAIVGDAAGGWPGESGNPGPLDINQMTTTDGVNYTLNDITLTDGVVIFRANSAWTLNWRGLSFSTGFGVTNSIGNGIGIPIVSGIWSVTFNLDSGAYSFISHFPNISLGGTAISGGAVALTSNDGVNYYVKSLTVVSAGTGNFVESTSNINPNGPYDNWSNSTFPSGTGISGGADIVIQPGNYNVSFNKSTGIYTFNPTIVSIIGDFNGWVGDVDFTTTDNITFSRLNYTFITGGGLKFRDNHNWVHNIGSATNPSTFPSGIAIDIMNSWPDINYTAGTFDITFNRTTLEYNFFKHTAFDDQITVAEGGTATTLFNNAVSVLNNDTFGVNLTAKLVSNVTNGSLTLNSDGTFSYVHNGSKTLSDSFTYKANNGTSDSNLATVNITVTPINDNAPTDILLSNSTLNENLNISIIGNFSTADIDNNNVFTYELISGAGDTGNSNFVIVNGNQLENFAPFDFETQSSYSIRVKVLDGNGHIFEKSFAINVTNVNDIDITYSAVNSYCSGSISINTVTNTTGVVNYFWTASNGGVVQIVEKNSANLTNLPVGTYTVSITDNYFSYSKNIDITFIPQYQSFSVCYITSDETDVIKNRIFINNQGNYNVGFYEILRETNISNYYTSIGTITASENTFLDANSDNTAKAYRYKVRLVDNCGNPSSNSAFHKTILLQSTVAINNSVSLSWTHYEGITYGTYNIYRKTNLGAFELIGSIASTDNAYNDQTANVLTNKYEYYVAIDVSSCATSVAGKIKATSSIRSNLQKLGNSLSIDTNVLSSEIILYPNPASTKVVLEIPESLGFSGIEIYNTLGQRIKSFKEKEFSVDFLPSGTYFIKIFTNQGTTVKNFVKE